MYRCDCAGAAIGWYRANCWGTTPPKFCAFWMDDGEVWDFAGRTFNGILQTTAGAVSTGPLTSSYEWYMISLPTKNKTMQERQNLSESNQKQVRSCAVGHSKLNSLKTYLLAFADFLIVKQTSQYWLILALIAHAQKCHKSNGFNWVTPTPPSLILPSLNQVSSIQFLPQPCSKIKYGWFRGPSALPVNMIQRTSALPINKIQRTQCSPYKYDLEDPVPSL